MCHPDYLPSKCIWKPAQTKPDRMYVKNPLSHEDFLGTYVVMLVKKKKTRKRKDSLTTDGGLLEVVNESRDG
jgi:hypothetical protein